MNTFCWQSMQLKSRKQLGKQKRNKEKETCVQKNKRSKVQTENE